ncbi:hypothetical protein [Parasutterella excrementihominis]|uniref:hypothetical protein n=1 Tax=Parasutterella excrementihominis TaxID=487175 RepID=UPI003520508A
MWKIKDPETLKEKINHMISDERLTQGCNRQMDDNSDYILLSCGDVDIRLKKESFENVPEYDPDGWNPFPALRPPRAGNYLVYLTENHENRIRISYFYNDYRGWDNYRDASIMAFKEFVYDAPGDDVLKFSERE